MICGSLLKSALPQSRTNDHDVVAAEGALFRLEKPAFDR